MSNVKMITVRLPGGAVPNYEQLFVGGVDIIDLLSKAVVGTPTATTGGSTDVMVSQELYVTTQAGVGFAVGDTLRRVEVAVSTTNTSTVGWYNITRSSAITGSVLGSVIRPAGESGAGISDAELRASPLNVDIKGITGDAIGAVDSAAAAEDGTGAVSLVGAVKRVITQLFTILQRIPVIGQKSTTASVSVALSNEHALLLDNVSKGVGNLHDRFIETVNGATQQKTLMVNVTNAADIGGGGGGGSVQKPVTVDDFVGKQVVGVDVSVGDKLRRITFYNTTATPFTTTVVWYNQTKQKYIATPADAAVQRPSAVLDQVVTYRVIKVAAGSVLSVAALETTLGGSIMSVQAYQESGNGQIIGDDGVGWDLPTGAAYSMSESGGVFNTMLDKTTQFKSTAGTLRLGVHYRKTSASGNGTYLTDGFGNTVSL